MVVKPFAGEGRVDSDCCVLLPLMHSATTKQIPLLVVVTVVALGWDFGKMPRCWSEVWESEGVRMLE
jgi:hypothetical protein